MQQVCFLNIKHPSPIDQSSNQSNFPGCFRCHLFKDGAPLFRSQRDADVDVQNLLQLVHLCHPVDLLISTSLINFSESRQSEWPRRPIDSSESRQSEWPRRPIDFSESRQSECRRLVSLTLLMKSWSLEVFVWSRPQTPSNSDKSEHDVWKHMKESETFLESES